MPSSKKQHVQRLHMAQIAARLMQEQGIRDFHIAKRKAAQHLGIDVRDSTLPTNREIETALAEHQRLFDGAAHADRLTAMREAALDAMQMLADFKPRLVGDVLSGLANAHSDIQLHVFAEPPESFDLFLQSRGILYDIVDRRLRVSRDAHAVFPAFRFIAGEFGFDAVLFAAKDIRQAPLSSVDGAPMQRANRERVARMLADDMLRSELDIR